MEEQLSPILSNIFFFLFWLRKGLGSGLECSEGAGFMVWGWV